MPRVHAMSGKDTAAATAMKLECCLLVELDRPSRPSVLRAPRDGLGPGAGHPFRRPMRFLCRRDLVQVVGEQTVFAEELGVPVLDEGGVVVIVGVKTRLGVVADAPDYRFAEERRM